MVESAVTARSPMPSADDRPALWPTGEVVRDIARGGIAGIIVGLFVAGLGGRLVMRLAAILHEDAVGRATENGEIIGVISLGGTVALMVFGGLALGLLAGAIWVIVSPWLPGRGVPRAVLTAVAAIALGTPPLIQGTNPDFAVLDRDPLVVGLLVALVGFVGFSIAIVDDVLEARLPAARKGTRATMAYLLVMAIGLALVLPLAIVILLDQPEYAAPIRLGWALTVVGGCTAAWWVLRARGWKAPPTAVRVGAAGSLLLACVLGVATGLPHILTAAGAQ